MELHGRGRRLIPAARLEQVTDKSGFMKTPKLRLELAGDQRSYVTIGFPKGGKNEFLKALTAAIAGAKLISKKVSRCL